MLKEVTEITIKFTANYLNYPPVICVDIVKRDAVFITVDHKMMEVAGDNSWGARPYPEYSIPARDYEFSFWIEPVL